MSTYHTPVLLQESVAGLDIKESGVYVDATLGGGGHTREILSHLGPKGRLMVFDRDSDALANAPKDKRIIVVHNNFRYIHHFVRYYGFEGVDGILSLPAVWNQGKALYGVVTKWRMESIRRWIHAGA